MSSPNFTAIVERVDVVESTPAGGDAMSKGLDFLKSRISLLGSGQHAEYTILVQSDGRTFTIRKRFSEFDTLHQFLKERFPDRLSFDLPAKTPVRYFSPEALEDRKNALNAYMKELCRRGDMTSTPQVQAFFGIVAPSYPGRSAADEPYSASAMPSERPAPKPARPRNDSDDDDLVGWDR
mmetsp:Transcript_42317/g.79253  ORF Transcript_42317/g.79253 Transcript_42317/m.79253 type:complete len:180 (+) Transcript_42317:138-677(+)